MKRLPILTLRGLRKCSVVCWLFWLWLMALAASGAGGGKDGKKKKPRPKEKKPLSEAQLEQRRKAGKARAKSFTSEYQSDAGKARAKAFTSEYQSRAWYAMLAKRGTEHLSQMGKRGWQAALARQSQFYEQGGISSRKHTLARLERHKPAKAKIASEPGDTTGKGGPASIPEPDIKQTNGSQ
jgi:hypothetical protein